MLNNIEIARLIERKQQAATTVLASEAQAIGGGCMGFDAPGSFMNRACGLGLDGPIDGAEIERLVAFYASRAVPANVEVNSYAHPSLVGELGARGFALTDVDHVFARDLVEGEDLEAQVAEAAVEGVVVRRLDTSDSVAVREYVTAVASGFVPEGTPIPDSHLQVGIRCSELPTFDGFVAWAEGRIVGAAGSDTNLGVTSLFGTTVLPAYRRRGIQKALVLARIENGRRSGSVVATIESRAGTATERNAIRLGFRMVCARFTLTNGEPERVGST